MLVALFFFCYTAVTKPSKVETAVDIAVLFELDPVVLH